MSDGLSWAGTPQDMRDELSARSGLPVTCAMLPGSMVGVEFRVIDGPPPWRKAFVLEPSLAVPAAFLEMLNGWRKNMSAKIATNDTDGVLGAVLAEFGETRVREALEVKGRLI